MEPLLAAAIAAALVFAAALVALVVLTSRSQRRTFALWREAEAARAAADADVAAQAESVRRADEAATSLAGLLRQTQQELAHLTARHEQLLGRRDELELELAQHRTSPLVGRLVVANTPKPDDQAVRGVVIRELDGGGLLLAGAHYLQPNPGGRGADVVEVPAGDVVVPRVSWTQLLSITPQEG